MEGANINASRIGIQIGAPVEEGNEKSSIKLTLGIGKSAADAQLSESKALIGGAEVGLSALISLVAAPGKQEELANYIDDLFNGKIPAKPSKEISKAVHAGFISHKVFQTDGNRVIVQIKPGTMTEDMINGQVTGVVQGFGIEAATATEKLGLTLNASAGVDFHDASEGHKTGLSTLATFGKAFKLEINASAPVDSLVDQKVYEILGQLQPNSPLALLKLLKTIDWDFSFRGIDELPADLQRKLDLPDYYTKFPSFPKSQVDTPEHEFLKKIVELTEPQIDIYAALENVAAIHVSIRTPGFGITFANTAS